MIHSYRIASYPFEFVIHTPDSGLTGEVTQALDQVLHAFRQPTSPHNPPAVFHEPLHLEIPFGQMHFIPDKLHYRVEIDLDSRAIGPTLPTLMDGIEPDIVNQAIRESPGHLWFHGSCLWRDDELILLVAKTGTGKTSLSLGLLHYGYRMLTDDIILIDLETCDTVPIPRTPKFRWPAPEQLRSMGFDLSHEANLLGHYIQLPPDKLYRQTTANPITRVYIMQRSAEIPADSVELSTLDGILGLIPYSNLMGIDPTLKVAQEIFHDTRFSALNLSHFPEDVRRIAEDKF